VLGYKDEHGQFRGDVVTVRHNGRNKGEASRIRSHHSDTTRVLEVGCAFVHAHCTVVLCCAVLCCAVLCCAEM